MDPRPSSSSSSLPSSMLSPPLTPFPTLPSPPPAPTSSLASALSLSLSPLLDFYLDAQQWASDARKSLEPDSPAPVPAALLTPPTPTPVRSDAAARRRLARAYPYSKPSLLAPLIKPEPLSPSLSTLSLPVVDPPPPPPAPPVPGRPQLDDLLRMYESMLWERVESCRRIEKLIGDSEMVLGELEGASRGRRRRR